MKSFALLNFILLLLILPNLVESTGTCTCTVTQRPKTCRGTFTHNCNSNCYPSTFLDCVSRPRTCSCSCVRRRRCANKASTDFPMMLRRTSDLSPFQTLSLNMRAGDSGPVRGRTRTSQFKFRNNGQYCFRVQLQSISASVQGYKLWLYTDKFLRDQYVVDEERSIAPGSTYRRRQFICVNGIASGSTDCCGEEFTLESEWQLDDGTTITGIGSMKLLCPKPKTQLVQFHTNRTLFYRNRIASQGARTIDMDHWGGIIISSQDPGDGIPVVNLFENIDGGLSLIATVEGPGNESFGKRVYLQGNTAAIVSDNTVLVFRKSGSDLLPVLEVHVDSVNLMNAAMLQNMIALASGPNEVSVYRSAGGEFPWQLSAKLVDLPFSTEQLNMITFNQYGDLILGGDDGVIYIYQSFISDDGVQQWNLRQTISEPDVPIRPFGKGDFLSGNSLLTEGNWLFSAGFSTRCPFRFGSMSFVDPCARNEEGQYEYAPQILPNYHDVLYQGKERRAIPRMAMRNGLLIVSDLSAKSIFAQVFRRRGIRWVSRKVLVKQNFGASFPKIPSETLVFLDDNNFAVVLYDQKMFNAFKVF